MKMRWLPKSLAETLMPIEKSNLPDQTVLEGVAQQPENSAAGDRSLPTQWEYLDYLAVP